MQDENDGDDTRELHGVHVDTFQPADTSCAGCGCPVVRAGLALRDCWRLPCWHFYCALCLPGLLHETLPLAPMCGARDRHDACGQSIRQCFGLRQGERVLPGGSVHEVPDFTRLCFPPVHTQYNMMEHRPEKSFAVTISVPEGTER